LPLRFIETRLDIPLNNQLGRLLSKLLLRFISSTLGYEIKVFQEILSIELSVHNRADHPFPVVQYVATFPLFRAIGGTANVGRDKAPNPNKNNPRKYFVLFMRKFWKINISRLYTQKYYCFN